MKFNQQSSQVMTNSLPTSHGNNKKNKNSRLNNKKTPIIKSAEENKEAIIEEKNSSYDINVKSDKVIFTIKNNDSTDAQGVLSELLKVLQEDVTLYNVAIIYESMNSDLYRLSDKDSETLISVLNLRQVKRISINNINIDKKPFKQISDALKHDDSLIGLELTKVNLGESTKYLAKAVAKNAHLQQLKLINNNLKDEDLILLSFALGKNKSLEGLQIDDEHISDLAINILANNIVNSKKLHILLMRNDHISQAGIKMLIDVAKTNSNFNSINVTGNNSSDTQNTEIDKLTKSNTELNKGIEKFKNIEKTIACMQEHFASAIELELSRAKFIPADAMKYLPLNFVENTVKEIGAVAATEGD